MDLHLDDVALFVRIVELGSLSAAARERVAPVSQVTRALARLEATCGARLLHRSTHALSLTDEGDAFLAHARRLLATRDDLQGELGGRRGGPSGWVRLSVSPVLAQAVIAPSLPSLYARHPQLHVDLSADDRIGLAEFRASTMIPVAGDTGVATLKMMLINMKEGGFISEHDYEIGSRIAECVCGGMVDPGSLVNEKWLLDLERRHFVDLAKTTKTQDRIEHMLKTGKPLRN